MNDTASAVTTNIAFITTTSAVAAIQSLHVDVSSSSHFATLLPGPKRLKKPFKSKARDCAQQTEISAQH